MSFNFKWPTFSDEFHKSAAQMLDSALNRGPKPRVIADDILVEELGMGTIPPELEILEIGDLGTDRFRGIFRLTYAGDAHLVLKTKVQANPLTKPNRPDIGLFPSSTASRGILFAAAPLVVPMHLRLSSVKLRAIVVLVVSKAKGITLVFKNDPLESVEVSSTFDSVAVIQKYLQQEIEGQLREMFREDLPGIIHRLSQKWLSGEVKQEKAQAKQRAEAAHDISHSHPRTRETPLSRSMSDPHNSFETASAPGGPSRRPRSKGRRSSGGAASLAAFSSRSPPNSPPKARTSHARRPRHGANAASTSAAPLHNELPLSFSTASASAFDSAFPEIENYDPTYGLRPDDLPTHSQFSGLGKLAQRVSAGLKDLTSQPTNDAEAAQQAATHQAAMASQDFAHDPTLQHEEDNGDVESDLTDHDSEDHRHDSFEDPDGSESEDGVFDMSADVDDVSDLDQDEDANALPDSSIDYSRFGYPPASAAFSDAHELNRASSIIFDEEPPSKGRRVRRPSNTSGRPTSDMARAPSARSARSVRSNTTAGSRRRKPQTEVVYETIPAVGGGTVTRPRVYHIASKVQPPEVDWDDEDTARPSHYGGTPSTRTGATRFGSDYGSATMGARSSRTNTVRGLNDSPHLGAYPAGDDSEESLLDLPPESYHGSSDQSQHRSSDDHRGGHSRASSVAPSNSFSAAHRSSGSSSGFGSALPSSAISSRELSGLDTMLNYSGSSTAPTSSQSLAQSHSHASSGLSSASPHAGTASGAAPTRQDSGITFRRNKSASHTRSKTHGSIDRAGFVSQASYGAGPGASATPARQRPIATRPGFTHSATTPQMDTGSWKRSPPTGSLGKESTLSASPSAGAHDSLSVSPFRDLSHDHGSPRGLSSAGGAFASATSSPYGSTAVRGSNSGATGGGNGGGGGRDATTHLSIDASAHFLDLVKSNHTLSPFTRNMEHFTVRSAPVTPGWQTLSASASVVGSSAASGTGTGTGSGSSSQIGAGASSSHAGHRAGRPAHPPHSRSHSSRSLHDQQATTPAYAHGRAGKSSQDAVSAASGSGPASSHANASPARRRRTFQLGASSGEDVATPPESPARSPALERSSYTSPQGGGGFSSFAGSGPRPFLPPGSSVSSSTSSSKGIRHGAKDLRRRSRPGSMGPPSEAARLSALRWEAIRE